MISSKNPTQKLIVPKGTFDRKYERNETGMSENNSQENFVISDKKTATEVFEFAAENSDVEFAQINLEVNKTEVSVVRTDHDQNSVQASSIAKTLDGKGFQVKEVIHNHNKGNGPSGFTNSGIPNSSKSGDRINALNNPTSQGQKIIYKIYDTITKKYIIYDGAKTNN